ncbi:DNA-binding response regulator [candidate division WOR-3 bacterium JGI_Cruoil_03_44_89]|uniref:DNA-binding response regulator n=1 Tax=candidate division WOR-3 bacterium JGI_Cruoil_03_44_89 TaxID=1973748 RepID=A0A235BYM3_UNCW3|nr:MAG: DNA-binding response regulator [candidate division WOR-3 bacterium JGI_Cruoil_03_44_89]
MAKGDILIVDDEADIVKVIQYNLEKEGYKTIPAFSGEDAVELSQKHLPALIILDLMLPGMDGMEVCRILRRDEETRDIPIIMLTAKGEEVDIVSGLEIGADDYITKPFKIKELIARVKAVLRRGVVPQKEKVLKVEDLKIDPIRYEVTLRGEPLAFTIKEFKLLFSLASSPGRVFTRDQLLDRIWGEAIVTDRTIDVHIKKIREKLEDFAKYIETVRGIGYRFKEYRW